MDSPTTNEISCSNTTKTPGKPDTKWEQLKQRFKDNPPTFKKVWLYNLQNKKFAIKVASAAVFLAIFMGMFLAGHFYSCILGYLIVIFIFHELISLKRKKEQENGLKMTQLLNWYFFFISILYLSLRQFRNLLVKESLDNRFLFLVFNQSRILCLVLWFIGFISFVLSLERKHVKY